MSQRNEGQFSKRDETPSARNILAHLARLYTNAGGQQHNAQHVAYHWLIEVMFMSYALVPIATFPDPRTITLRPVHNTESKHHANNVHPAAPNKHHKRPLSLKECRWTRALQLEPRGCVSTHHTTNFQLCSRRDNRHLGTTQHP